MTAPHPRTETPSYKKTAARAIEEMRALMLGRGENMSMKEALDLLSHAAQRTNLTLPEDQLTDEQHIWKDLYKTLDGSIAKHLDPETKAEVDSLMKQREVLNHATHALSQLDSLALKIEGGLIEQRVHISMHFDDEDMNQYRKQERDLSTMMVDEKSPAELRIKAAQLILEINDNYSQTMIALLKEKAEKLRQWLSEFETHMVAAKKLENGEQAIMDASTWLELSQELYLARVMAITGIERSVQADRVLPKAIIETGGTKNILGDEVTQDMMQNVAAYGALLQSAKEKETEISQKRDPLTKELWPHMDEAVETYIQDNLVKKGATPKELSEAARAGEALSDWLPRGVVRKLIMITLLVIGARGLVGNPWLLLWIPIACLFSPRIMGEVAIAVGKSRSK